MSRGKILLGFGGAGVTTLAALFGNSKIKEHNYRIKMEKFRKTAKRVNGYLNDLVNRREWDKDTKIYDPEHEIWDRKFQSYMNQWHDNKFQYVPPKVKNNLESFKNFCFEQMESNAEKDLKDINASNIPPEKGYLEYCLVSDVELKQLIPESQSV
ncbi:hypothetical protein MHC_03100 [Mycoplasma haemocanis str. Illinois]|uniref:Uncharacterized protein n=1 Tax=Mycoplasma haemocanis (strain Illinois) TaxID=1111676 RepID=H6N758_MYCHN|nr:hypothetical protein [Mycoplasma haemocanis]AEW45480.1 hypothetical protein MHC_03100 [Mycoplasma haemocanis str. Illinois]